MIHSEEQIVEFHKALHVGCDKEPLRPTYSDLIKWGYFLKEMEPLEDSEGGPFTVADIATACALMKRLNREKGAGWGMRPSRIIQDPESAGVFRDLILEARKGHRKRPPAPEAIQALPDGTIRKLDGAEEPDRWTEASAEATAMLDKFKREQGR